MPFILKFIANLSPNHFFFFFFFYKSQFFRSAGNVIQQIKNRSKGPVLIDLEEIVQRQVGVGWVGRVGVGRGR